MDTYFALDEIISSCGKLSVYTAEKNKNEQLAAPLLLCLDQLAVLMEHPSIKTESCVDSVYESIKEHLPEEAFVLLIYQKNKYPAAHYFLKKDYLESFLNVPAFDNKKAAEEIRKVVDQMSEKYTTKDMNQEAAMLYELTRTDCEKLRLFASDRNDPDELYFMIRDIFAITGTYSVQCIGQTCNRRAPELMDQGLVIRSNYNDRKFPQPPLFVSVSALDEFVEAISMNEKQISVFDVVYDNLVGKYDEYLENKDKKEVVAGAPKRTNVRLKPVTSSDCGALTLYTGEDEKYRLNLVDVLTLLQQTTRRYNVKPFLDRYYSNHDCGDNIALEKILLEEKIRRSYTIKISYVKEFLSREPRKRWRYPEAFDKAFKNLLHNAGLDYETYVLIKDKNKKEVAAATPVAESENITKPAKESSIVISKLSKELLKTRDNIDELVRHVAALEAENTAYKNKINKLNDLFTA